MTYVILKAKSFKDIDHYDMFIIEEACNDGPSDTGWLYHCAKIIARFESANQAAAYVKASSLFDNTKYTEFYNKNGCIIFISDEIFGRYMAEQFRKNNLNTVP